jgi:hypothetical protein
MPIHASTQITASSPTRLLTDGYGESDATGKPLAGQPTRDTFTAMGTVNKIEQAAMGLPPKKRARLAGMLMESLATKQEKKIAESWADEAAARAKAFRKGTLKSLPLKKAFGFEV